MVCLCAVVTRAQTTTLTGSFTGATLDPGWQVGGSGYTPQLTANGLGDTAGSGYLQLTSSAGNEATYAVNTTAFASANATITATFNFASFNGTGADGITFFLADASQTFGVGAYGGSLGYAQKTVAGGGGANINGMNGGYIGVGIDEYGNYSNPSEGRIGGSGFVPNAIAVRGPGQGLTGYNYLGGTNGLGTALSFSGSTTRPTGANLRSLQIIITATNQMSVYLQTGGSGPYTLLYSIDLSGYARPNNLIMGFTGSTGGSTDVHQVNDVALTSVVSNIWTNGAGDLTWGKQGTTNSDANWNNTPASNPAVGGDILFDNSHVSVAQAITVINNQVVRNLQIDAPFSYTLTGGSIELNGSSAAGPTGIFVTQTHGAANQTINSNLSLDNAVQVQNNSTGTLALGGDIALGAFAATINGSGAVTSTGVISGTGSIAQTGTGTTTLSGNNTYTGGTTISSGTLNANSNTALGATSGAVTLSGGTLGSTNSSTISNAVALTGSAGLSGITTAGTLTQTGGSYTVSMTNATQSGAVKLSDTNTGRTLTVNTASGTTSTISGLISNGGSGAGTLTKTGNGTLVLSNGTGALNGGNTYTGGTNLSGGTLQLNQSNTLAQSGNLNMAAGTTLALNNNSQAIGNLTISGNSTLDFGAGGYNAFVFAGLTNPSNYVLTVNNYTGATNGVSTQALATTTAALGATLLNDIYFAGSGSGTIEQGSLTSNDGVSSYRITPNTTFSTWNGASGANSNYETNANWVGGTFPGSGNSVKVDFTGSTRLNPTLTAADTVNSVKFDSGAGSFTLSSSVAADTYTLAGVVPSIIQQSANAQTISTSKLILGANTVVDVSGAGALNITAPISGAFSLQKLSAGTLNLSGANTYSGGTQIGAGVVGVSGNNTALGSGAATVSNGATLQVNGPLSIANNLTINGAGAVNGAIDSNPGSGTATLSGAITLGSNSTISSDSGTLAITTGGVTGAHDLTVAGAGATTISGAITTGAGALNVNTTGAGSLTLSGANTFTGATTVNSGTLNLSGAGTTINGSLVGNGGTINQTTSNQVASGSAVSLNSGSYKLSNGVSQTYTGAFNTSAGSTLQLGTSGAGAALTLNQTNTDTINGVISGTGSLTTSNTGTTVLGGTNTYSGGTTTSSIINVTNSSGFGTGAVAVNAGGNIQIQNNVTLANAFTTNSTGTAFAGAFENLSGNNTVSGAVTVAGTTRIQSDSGSLTVSGAVGLGANTLNVGGNANTNLNGAITGTGSSAITKDGTGTLALGAANPAFAGSVTVNGGTLQANVSNVFNTSNAITVNTSAILSLNGTTQSVATLNDTAASSTLSFGSGGSLTLGTGNSTLLGSINGSGTLILNSGSVLTLGSNFNDAGLNIVLNGGMLKLNGTTDTFGSLTVNMTSVIDFASPSTSVLNVNGVSLSGSSQLSVQNWANMVDYFYSGSDSNKDSQITFAGYGGPTHWNTYTSGPGPGNEITPAPEPATYGAIFVGLSLAGIVALRRRRSAS